MSRPHLTKRQYVVKVLDLIEAFGGGGPACRQLAEKWGVDRTTVYRWSSYTYATEPMPPNRKRLLRLWYYHCRNHRGDKRTKKVQDTQAEGARAMPAVGLSEALNPDSVVECSEMQ